MLIRGGVFPTCHHLFLLAIVFRYLSIMWPNNIDYGQLVRFAFLLLTGPPYSRVDASRKKDSIYRTSETCAARNDKFFCTKAGWLQLETAIGALDYPVLAFKSPVIALEI